MIFINQYFWSSRSEVAIICPDAKQMLGWSSASLHAATLAVQYAWDRRRTVAACGASFFWRFPETGVPPVIIHWKMWDFSCKPFSYWGTPHEHGNPQQVSCVWKVIAVIIWLIFSFSTPGILTPNMAENKLRSNNHETTRPNCHIRTIPFGYIATSPLLLSLMPLSSLESNFVWSPWLDKSGPNIDSHLPNFYGFTIIIAGFPPSFGISFTTTRQADLLEHNKQPIWEPPIYGDLGVYLLYCSTHIIPHFQTQSDGVFPAGRWQRKPCQRPSCWKVSGKTFLGAFNDRREKVRERAPKTARGREVTNSQNGGPLWRPLVLLSTNKLILWWHIGTVYASHF